jgi:hypothetical protein
MKICLSTFPQAPDLTGFSIARVKFPIDMKLQVQTT